MNPAAPHLILDFDASVLPLAPDELRLDLGDWQEDIRFACSPRNFARLRAALAPLLPPEPGVTFLGSGDYHHVTALLLDSPAVRASAPVDLVVCDNHPDNMRYPLGIHCGSWVSHASRLPHVRHIHVVGISSPDISWKHAWENRLRPLFRKKLTYWSVRQSARWLNALGLADRHRNFPSPEDLLATLLPCLRSSRHIYLSLDKDVLCPEDVPTTWDQGTFRPAHVRDLVTFCADRLAGMDVCGDASVWRPAGWGKRLLRRLDGLCDPAPSTHIATSVRHWIFNKNILDWLRKKEGFIGGPRYTSPRRKRRT
jgi:hypothetical protein